MNKNIWAIVWTLLLSVSTLWAEEFPAPMHPPRLVNDFTGTFTSIEQQELETFLVHFDQSTSTQIAVVTIPDLYGYDISDYATRLFEKWGIGGSKDKNNGVLILLKPKTNSQRGEVFICVGYGLEGVIPDAIAKRIVDKEMIPYFKNDDYYSGVKSAIQTIVSLTKGEFTAEEYNDKDDDTTAMLGGLIFMIVIFVLITVISKNGGNRGGGFSGSSGGFGVPPIFMSGGRSSGGSSGFGGFGGGFTGGGGAGGSW